MDGDDSSDEDEDDELLSGFRPAAPQPHDRHGGCLGASPVAAGEEDEEEVLVDYEPTPEI